MNSRSIQAHLRSKLEEWLDSLPVHIRGIVRNNVVVTGGAIVSLLQGEEPKDYDLYFKSFTSALTVARHYGNIMGVKVFEHGANGNQELTIAIGSGYVESPALTPYSPYSPLFMTSNAISLTDKIQLITRFYGTIDDIHSNFDFIHCQSHYDLYFDKLVLNPKSLESILSKELFYCGSKYPLASILRARKFLNRGWSCNAGQYLKMALQLQEFDLNNPEVLRDQLMGVDLTYFMNMMSQINQDSIRDGRIDQTYLVELINKFF